MPTCLGRSGGEHVTLERSHFRPDAASPVNREAVHAGREPDKRRTESPDRQAHGPSTIRRDACYALSRPLARRLNQPTTFRVYRTDWAAKRLICESICLMDFHISAGRLKVYSCPWRVFTIWPIASFQTGTWGAES